MDPRSFLKGLHPLEIKVLLRYAPGDGLDAARLAAELGYVEGHANQAQAWLSAKGLAAESGRSSRNVYVITSYSIHYTKLYEWHIWRNRQ